MQYAEEERPEIERAIYVRRRQCARAMSSMMAALRASVLRTKVLVGRVTHHGPDARQFRPCVHIATYLHV